MVKVSIIDSGARLEDLNIDPAAIEGVRIIKRPQEGLMLIPNEIEDHIGHGTVCLDTIRSYCSNTQFLVVKIFDELLYSDETILVKAIEHSLQWGAHVINVSIGISGVMISERLQEVCDQAYDQNVIMVAAAHNYTTTVCYPAHYPKVFGVGPINIKHPEEFHYLPESPIEFLSSDKLWFNFKGQRKLFLGNSFACPKISGQIAAIINQDGPLTFEAIKEKMIQRASSIDFKTKLYPLKNNEVLPPEDVFTFGQKWFSGPEKFEWVKRMQVLPLNDYRFYCLEYIDHAKLDLPFELIGPFHAYDREYFPTILAKEEEHHSFDTIAIGNLGQYLTPISEEKMAKMLSNLLKKGKNFFVFDRFTKVFLEELQQALKTKNTIFFSDLDRSTYDQIEQFQHLPSLKVPVIGVISSSNKGTLHLQIKICQALKNRGYKVAFFSTSTIGDLAGASFSFSLNAPSAERLTAEEKIKGIRSILKSLQAYYQPDIIVSGLPAEVVPNGTIGQLNWTDNMNFLYGLQADVLICEIDEADRLDRVLENLVVAKAFSRAPELCFIRTKSWRPVQPNSVKCLDQINDVPVFGLDDIDFEEKLLEHFLSYFQVTIS